VLRGLAEDTAKRHGLEVGSELVRRTATEFRRAHGLYTGPSMAAWLDDQGLDPEAFFHMMTREARLRWTLAVSEPEVRRHLVDQLRAMNWYGRLSNGVRAKQAALQREAVSAADLPGSADRDPEALWQWYFHERLGRRVPEDLAGYAERFGFGDPGALLRAVLIEHWYATHSPEVRHRSRAGARAQAGADPHPLDAR
jgi:hypothetical protein